MRLQSRFSFVARPFPSSRPPFSEGDGAPRHERRANIWLGITPEEIPPSSGPEKPRPIAFCLCAVCVCVLPTPVVFGFGLAGLEEECGGTME